MEVIESQRAASQRFGAAEGLSGLMSIRPGEMSSHRHCGAELVAAGPTQRGRRLRIDHRRRHD
jgi:hypothetical protein